MILNVKVNFPIFIQIEQNEIHNFSDVGELEDYIYKEAGEYLETSSISPVIDSFYLEDENGVIIRNEKLETLLDIMKLDSLNKIVEENERLKLEIKYLKSKLK